MTINLLVCNSLENFVIFKMTAPFKMFKICLLSTDKLEVFSATLITVIFLMVLFSSFFDKHLQTQSAAIDDHYESRLKSRSHRVLTIFSVKRNWKVLSAPTKNDSKDLQFIDFIRTFGIFGTVYSHTVLYSAMTPSVNPVFIDNVSSAIISSL